MLDYEIADNNMVIKHIGTIAGREGEVQEGLLERVCSRAGLLAGLPGC